MQTRFTSLVKVKKNAMDRSERELQQAHFNLNQAQEALQSAYKELENTTVPQSGTMAEMLFYRHLLTSVRQNIEDKKAWLKFANEQLEASKKHFKAQSIEYEKYKYLETQEINELLKKMKLKEAKALDEVALMGYMNRRNQLI